uniref:Uncharacterized protein n=1 Tax=Glossina palpalis gambiensis TaxID=67801 RepID=A0A1B0BYH6_9MUSC
MLYCKHPIDDLVMFYGAADFVDIKLYLTELARRVSCISRQMAASADAPVYSICECHSGMHLVVSYIVAEVYKPRKKMKFDSVKMTFIGSCIAFTFGPAHALMASQIPHWESAANN